MATALQAFTNHEFGTIRTITSGGQILFCGRDVATALGYANTKDALVRHCKGVVNHYPLETAGGIQQVRFISEGDLYRLIVSSNLPAAEQFEAWVFDDVLPSIRRHGMYAIDELLNDDEFLRRAIATLRGERDWTAILYPFRSQSFKEFQGAHLLVKTCIAVLFLSGRQIRIFTEKAKHQAYTKHIEGMHRLS